MPFFIAMIVLIAAVVVIKKYYKMWYGPCDECGTTDPNGLLKADILWNKKPLICHTCQEIYKVVLLGQKIPSGASVAEADVSSEVGRRRWVSQWVRGSFFENKKPKG